jgi:NAD+ synthetase
MWGAMRVGLAQINPCTGDLEGNVDRCLAAIAAAQDQGAELIVLPEMAVPGFAPRDILLDPSFVAATAEATADLAAQARGAPPVVAGTIGMSASGLCNQAVLLQDGKVTSVAGKQRLRDEDVFYEHRWFVPGSGPITFKLARQRIGLLLHDDLPEVRSRLSPPPDLLVVLAASPYTRQAMDRRLQRARQAQLPVIWVNLCGGNDELVFDGRSFVLAAGGKLVACLAACAEDGQVVDTSAATTIEPPTAEWEQEVFQALVLGVRDFAAKNRIERAVLGLSGGIDSALVATLAAEALTPERVTALAIPSRFTDPSSTSLARELATALGIGFEVVELEPLHAAAEAVLAELVETGTVAENIQARLRMMILMAHVNHYRGLLLNTSNKTELALGYGTTYGDLAGTLCPIADLGKPEVYAVVRWLQRTRGLIPEPIITRPPSAELRPHQVDPFDYDDIAPLLEHLVQTNQSNPAMRRAEAKRWQLGVVLKVTDKAFGSGRLIPITRR